MEITGTAKDVGELETFPSGFSKRRLIIEAEDGKYKNLYGFEFLKDAAKELDPVKPNDTVKVQFNLGRANLHNGKYYSNFPTGWKLEIVESSKPEKPANTIPDNLLDDNFNGGSHPDIPF